MSSAIPLISELVSRLTEVQQTGTDGDGSTAVSVGTSEEDDRDTDDERDKDRTAGATVHIHHTGLHALVQRLYNAPRIDLLRSCHVVV